MQQKFLIIRLSAIGDIVMSSCIAPGLKATHPHAKNSWLVQKGLKNLFEANPAVDALIGKYLIVLMSAIPASYYFKRAGH